MEEQVRALWSRFVAAATEYDEAMHSLLRPLAREHGPVDPERDVLVQVLRDALTSRRERKAALRLLGILPKEYALVLFEETVSASLKHDVNEGPDPALRILRDLPSAAVRDRLRPTIERLLSKDPGLWGARLFEVSEELDRSLCSELAQRATESADQNIRQLGTHFLRLIQS